MHIEGWADTAFGTDFGGDFLELVERIASDTLTLTTLFEHCDLERYLRDPGLLAGRTDNNVRIAVAEGSNFEKYVHYEDAVIALAAIVAECKANGCADLSQAYGSRTLRVRISDEERSLITEALRGIHDHPHRYVLFEMCPGEAGEQVLADLCSMLRVLDDGPTVSHHSSDR